MLMKPSWVWVASTMAIVVATHTPFCVASHVPFFTGPGASTKLSSSFPKRQSYDFISTFPRGGAAATAASKRKNKKVGVAKKDSNAPKISGDGTASIPNEVFNLVKIIVGSGVLGLSSGIAAFGDAPGALIPACALIFITGGFGAYSFNLIGQICSLTGSRTYKEAWSSCVGESSNWFPTVCVFMVTFFSAIAYSMILTDTISQLFESYGTMVQRSPTLVAITILLLLPLCLLKNLSSLAPFSLLGIVGMAYTCIAMAIRYFEKSYALPQLVESILTAEDGTTTTKTIQSAAGRFLESVSSSYQPKFGSKGASSIWCINSFIYLCMLSTAYMAHFNAPKLYVELYNNTIPRFRTMVNLSFGISIIVFCAVASFGFLTFGAASNGLILNNYSTKDTLMSLSRFAVAASILFSYPLNFVGVRDSVLELLNVPETKRTNAYLNTVTAGLLVVVTGLAFVITDLKFLLSMIGSTWGNTLIYIVPSIMFIQLSKKLPDMQGKVQYTAWFTAILGVVMSIIGTTMTLKY